LVQQLGRRLLSVYLVVTLVLGVALVTVVLRLGTSGFHTFQVPGHGSSLAVNFIAFCLSWLLLGGLIGLTQFPSRFRRHAAFVLVSTLMAFAYLNVVREPHQIAVGDFGAYFHAAECVRQGVPIEQKPDRLYLYPPLLATVLSPLVPLGLEDAAKAFRLFNYGAVLLLLPLLYLSLLRYRFTPEIAAFAVLCALAANVPIARTLIYNQINLHVENLILVSLLVFGRHTWLSALCLALAAQLKVSPLVLALPFVLTRAWRWCGWFVGWQLAIIALTSLANSPQYYIEFVQQSASLRETALRNVSVDALMYNTFRLAGLDGWAGRDALALVLRGVLGVAVLMVYWRLARRRLVIDEDGDARVIATGFAILPLLMIAVSPSIWEHHFVFLILPMLVLASVLREPRDVCLYGLAYVFVFLFPVYDIYPVSYLRLIAILLLLALYARLARRHVEGEASWFRDLKQRLAAAFVTAQT
jgi:hypothetical protein